jgi:hypothetical protein
MISAQTALIAICVVEALIIVALLLLNAALHAHLRTIEELINDTGLSPLDGHLTGKAANDGRP